MQNFGIFREFFSDELLKIKKSQTFSENIQKIRENSMKNLDKFYINGAWVEPISSDKFPVINPANEDTIGHISLGGERDVDNAVVAANKAFLSFSIALSASSDNLFKHKFNGSSVTLSKFNKLPLHRLSIIANQPYPLDADCLVFLLKTDGYKNIAEAVGKSV